MFDQRYQLQSDVVYDTNDYRIVEFGNSWWVISKIGDPPLRFPKESSEKPLYPNRNGHSGNGHSAENPLSLHVVLYQAPQLIEEKA